jgi:hypothetical protein
MRRSAPIASGTAIAFMRAATKSKNKKGVDMKILTILSLMAVSVFSGAAFANGQNSHEAVVPVIDVYVPSGFDSSSDAFVVVNGLFPSTCYKLKNATVNHVGPALHEVSTKAFVLEGTCLMVMVPFHKEVQLGKLAQGDHILRFINGDSTYMDRHLVIEK